MRNRYNQIKNLKRVAFSNKVDSIVSLIIICIGITTLGIFSKWMIFSANWSVVSLNLPLFLFGSFPNDQLWRPGLWISLFAIFSLITLWGPQWSWLRKSLPLLWVSYAPLGILLLAGGIGLSPVESQNWGGLTLTILLTSCSAILSLPLGIALALGRQSTLPIVKSLSSFYIDIMRSIPLIAVLFFGQLLIPLFLPVGLEIDRVSRAIIAFTLFVSAYIAEDVRGGLQSISRTQKEAGEVLGLHPFQITYLIILPQALRVALPSLTNQAVGLLQNTSLMAILGLVELLGVGRSILANPEFIGRYIEVYLLLAAIYWIVGTLIALIARHLEQQMTLEKKDL